MISIKAMSLYQKVADMVLCPPAIVRGPCLHIYSILILFISLWKIDQKSKSNGNYLIREKNVGENFCRGKI